MHEEDTPFNCFPSLHVAQSFLSALTCGIVHRGLGRIAGAWACLIAVSTLFTKQHYVADVVAGAALSGLGYAIFLGRERREKVPAFDRVLAPVLAWGCVGLYGLLVLGM